MFTLPMDSSRFDDLPATRPAAESRSFDAAQARDAGGRRGHDRPATCGRDRSAEEREFMLAMQEYKQTSGRMFPTWSETLEVLRALGYRKQA